MTQDAREEVIRRAELQFLSMKMLDALDWNAEAKNSERLKVYRRELGKAVGDAPALSEIWQMAGKDRELKPLFDAMGPGGRRLLRQGSRGDRESTEIFLYLTDWLQKQKMGCR
ncbi:hypothetical protein YT14_004651 [Salmonella enterica subsp. enterica serovar Oslo]|nr:hypothetical protein [Salmonella enterica subsp. enterica serovar Oslo]